MRVQIVLRHIAVTQHLEKEVGVHILYLLGDHHFGGDPGGNHCKADPHTGRKNLGKSGAVNNQSLSVKALEGGKILPGKPQFAIGVVLDDRQGIFFGDFVDGVAFFL